VAALVYGLLLIGFKFKKLPEKRICKKYSYFCTSSVEQE